MSLKPGPTPIRNPKIGAAQIRLLEQLCNAGAVAGDEAEVRDIIIGQLRQFTSDMKVDALGNLLVIRRGEGERRLKVLMAAHMDEIGFMLSADDGEGLFRFELVGGIDTRSLPGKPVWIGKEHVPGVIGARPIHLTTREERQRGISLENLRIDIGPGGDSKVKVGDRAVFGTPFTRLGPSVYAKALDDRLGVATLIELVKNAPKNIDLMAAFTVQEEIGLRGARVAAYALAPDIAIAVDSTPANDLPNWDGSENTAYNTRLDAGPAIYIADGGMLSDPRLVRHFAEAAERQGIPYQYRQPGGGSTDAAAMQRQLEGIPSLAVSVPGRYAHTAGGIARVLDWQNTLALLYVGLESISPDLIQRDG